MSVTIYGIKNCDTMKKARTWLDERSIDYRFHDYKAEGIDQHRLQAWSKGVAGRPCSIAPAPPSANSRRMTVPG